ncbi:MAG: type IX secretion system membrane protein PorP/SprF [Bacteroidetes bacterium]|nr:type IX secretion system membrane protein PorP/SprF [Bacteroidota bacterium]
MAITVYNLMQALKYSVKLYHHCTFVILILLGVLWVSESKGQQTSLITNYMFSNMVFNPAYAGQSGGISITGLIREQWFGFKDSDGNKVAPETMFLTIDAPIRAIHGGIGGMVAQDRIGFFKNTSVKLGYAYKAELGSGIFSAGLQLGFQNGKFDYSQFKAVSADDPLLTADQAKSDMIFDLSLGLMYRVPDKFYVGLSGDQLLQSKGKNTQYKLQRTFYLTGGYQYDIPNHPVFSLQPSAIVMFDGAAFQFSVSGLVWYNNKFYGGLAYRFQDAVSVLAGLSIKGFRLGLAYDIGISKMMKYSNGSFEVMLNYVLKIETEKLRRSYRNTRFL